MDIKDIPIGKIVSFKLPRCTERKGKVVAVNAPLVAVDGLWESKADEDARNQLVWPGCPAGAFVLHCSYVKEVL